MRTILYAFFLAAIVVGVTKLAMDAPAFREDFQEGRPKPPESRIFTSHGRTKTDYIAFLRRTTSTDTVEAQQELQRRIEAVENFSHWR